MIKKKSPPGRTKIMEALRNLLQTKEFSLITTAEIAKTAGVTEGLIYKYFEDKQELLFTVLEELFESVLDKITNELAKSDDPLEQFRAFIYSTVSSYATSKVFSRIILLEVRKSSRFFSSGAYKLVQYYSNLLSKIIEDGVRKEVFRPDLNVVNARNITLGAIEHACLHSILFNKKIMAEGITDSLCDIMFDGIKEQGQ